MSSLICLDPEKRLTAPLALRHRWVTGHAASKAHLPDTHASIMAFNARRKVKGAVRTIQAVHRFINILKT